MVGTHVRRSCPNTRVPAIVSAPSPLPSFTSEEVERTAVSTAASGTAWSPHAPGSRSMSHPALPLPIALNTATKVSISIPLAMEDRYDTVTMSKRRSNTQLEHQLVVIGWLQDINHQAPPPSAIGSRRHPKTSADSAASMFGGDTTRSMYPTGLLFLLIRCRVGVEERRWPFVSEQFEVQRLESV